MTKRQTGSMAAVLLAMSFAFLIAIAPGSPVAKSAYALDSGVAAQATLHQAAPLAAQDDSSSGSITSKYFDAIWLESFGGISSYSLDGSLGFYLELHNGDTSGTLTVKSSDTDVASVSADCASFAIEPYDYPGYHYVYLDAKSYGTATITVSYLGDTVSFPVVVYPDSTNLKSVTKAAYNSVKLTWDVTPGASGYRVIRGTPDNYTYDSYFSELRDYKEVAVVKNQQGTTVTLKAEWDKDYSYAVVPYLDYGSKRFEAAAPSSNEITYALPKASVSLRSVTKSGAKALKLAWKADAGASGFEVYRSTSENYGYKLVGKTTSATFTDKKVKKGTTYYYKVRATYAGYGSVESNTIGQIIVKKSSVIRKIASKISSYSMRQGTYVWSNWSSPDNVFYYTQGSRLYMVSYTGKALKVYGFNSKMKKVSTKTVKLPKHDEWGGFYHGPDGNNYVAIGYDNPKESKSKVVIKVMKFNKKWKKGKTASIKGSASNSFQGIYIPFDAGTASFDMQGNALYLFTAREMFAGSDGVHHQSNIAFSIDAKTMKAKVSNVAYTSHSFNQRVKFKDGTIFLADHGDAYDRGIVLTSKAGYGPDNVSYEPSSVPFAFMGETGANYTGATMGGMEVSPTTVLICGTSQPHKYKVAGVKGFGSYRKNVYVTVTNRATGKSSVKWLTKINPKKGKKTVGETRMVKLSDDRFAILYSVTSDKSGKSVFHYDVVNANGKRVIAKTYKNVAFSGGSQPVLYDGSICWSEYKSWESFQKRKATIYKIPALA